jgi:L-ascorbate metabolism protein UlaG (beta-lactamase superfamily)
LDAHQTQAIGYSLRATSGGSIYFAGDTAYGPMFKKFRAAFGAHDVALVPIGAYEPRKEVRFIHASPEEGLRIATDIGAQIAVGMHWGTFPLSGEPVFEPAQRFMRAARLDGTRPVALRIGGYLDLTAYRGVSAPPLAANTQ